MCSFPFGIWSCQHTCQRGFSATLLLFCIRRDGPTKPSRTEHSQLERDPRCGHVDSTGNELDKQKGKVHTRGEEVGNFPTPHNMSRARTSKDKKSSLTQSNYFRSKFSVHFNRGTAAAPGVHFESVSMFG